jgi:MFS family permease
LTDIIFLLGAILLSTAPTISCVIIGRIVVGFAVAVSAIADVSYLHEMSPIHVRGAVVSVNEACIAAGFLLAFAVGHLVATDPAESSSSTSSSPHLDLALPLPEGWRTMFGLSGIVAVIQFVGMWTMPESSVWINERSKQHLFSMKRQSVLAISNKKTDTTVSSSEQSRLPVLHDHQIHGTEIVDDVLMINSVAAPTRKIAMMTSPNTRQLVQYHSISSKGLQLQDNQSTRDTSVAVDYQSDTTTDEDSDHTDGQQYANPILWLTSLSSAQTRSCIVAVFLAVAQQFCGQTVVLSYAPHILATAAAAATIHSKHGTIDVNSNNSTVDSNVDEFNDVAEEWATLSIGLVKFAVTVIVIWKIERCGRRNLLLSGMATIAMGLLLLTFSFAKRLETADLDSESPTDDNADVSTPQISSNNRVLVLPAILLVVTGYSMSFGPLTWLLTSEMFPTEIRGRALGMSTIVTYFCAAAVTNTFLSAQQWIGARIVFTSYCFITCVALVFASLAIPETGGKSVTQIEREMNEMPFWRKFGRDHSEGAPILDMTIPNSNKPPNGSLS